MKPFIGSQELIKDLKRFCLYIKDSDLNQLKSNSIIQERLNGVVEMRRASTKKATIELANYPNRFAEDRYFNKSCLLIPCVTSGRREYMPVGYISADPVIYASAQAIYDAPLWIFSIINSKSHVIWVKTVGGRLREDIRYSSSLCYNAYPFPSISKQRKEELTQCALKIIDERLKHSEKTLAQLYDPDKMPEGLREAHHQNDLAVERCYRSTPFNSDEERLEYLFKLYEKMIQEEKDKDTLFAKEKKTRKRK